MLRSLPLLSNVARNVTQPLCRRRLLQQDRAFYPLSFRTVRCLTTPSAAEPDLTPSSDNKNRDNKNRYNKYRYYQYLYNKSHDFGAPHPSQPRAHRSTSNRSYRVSSELRSRMDPASSPSIPVILQHLTDVPIHGKRRLAGSLGTKRLMNLKRLHTALQTPTDTDAIWEAYKVVQAVPEDYEWLSEDVLRLIVIYFKEATTPSHQTKRLGSRAKDANQTLYARIVTLLNDKRKRPTLRFTRWDYSDLMSALNRLGQYNETLKEVDRALESGIKMGSILLNHAVRAWGGLGNLDKALETIEHMKSNYDTEASEYTLGYVTQELILAGKTREAAAFWDQLATSGTMDDIETVNGILRACATTCNSRFAQTVYDALPKLRMESNLESLNQMLRLAVMEARHPEEKIQLLQSVNDKMADQATFGQDLLSNILINFAKKGDADGALSTYRIMLSNGVPPRLIEHNNILHCFARLQQMDEAIDWFQHMRRAGIQPNQPSYALLMQSFVRQRMPRQTEALFRQLLHDGLEPDLAVCNYLLMAYEQARMNRRCLQLYTSMFRNPSIGVDHYTLNCMFNAVFHGDKAQLEGSEGLDAQGSQIKGTSFLVKISEPIGSLISDLQLENSGGETLASSQHELSQPSLSPVPQKYMFDEAVSTTESLNPRTLFRDMIITGIRPSRTLYGNVLRAFLSQNDYAGATVAMRALLDYYVLKPSPKMNAIVVAWVSKEVEVRGRDDKEGTHIKSELSKLVHMMVRSRGLVEMLEKVVTMRQCEQSDSLDDSVDSTSPPTSKARISKGNSEATGKFPEDPIAVARMEMGGDLVDLTQKSTLTPAFWSTGKDDTSKVDLKDFAQWYPLYLKRARYTRAIQE
ncbi:hypothetical protein B0O80DRAFT_451274 [Mortierella sp. GBAus27b]|nr:hypothetical protein B0O80DRAFT_451274 [Mortierella sp. GBAus27b]